MQNGLINDESIHCDLAVFEKQKINKTRDKTFFIFTIFSVIIRKDLPFSKKPKNETYTKRLSAKNDFVTRCNLRKLISQTIKI